MSRRPRTRGGDSQRRGPPSAPASRSTQVALYAVLVLCLSQLGSNVPTVMFLSAKLSASQLSPHVHETAWAVLAFSSTVAGNLTLTGSVANLITAEKANLSGLELSFGRHLRFALPTTVVIAVGGSLLVFVSASRWV
jgi:Na+/H+ antiporter NhaD/arsenite permease-like protein